MDFKTWIRQNQDKLEDVIITACDNYHREFIRLCPSEYINFDFQQAEQDLNQLVGNDDCCYDRLSSPYLYALRYQARRISAVCDALAPELLRHDEKHLYVFDLGAGTGATQMVLGLWAAWNIEQHHCSRSVQIINIDLSPFMLRFLEKSLWPAFISAFPAASGAVCASYNVNSWHQEAAMHHFKNIINPWIICSYLFDLKEPTALILHKFEDFLSVYKPSVLVFMSPISQVKRLKVQELRVRFSATDYLRIETPKEHFFGGELKKIPAKISRLSDVIHVAFRATSLSWQENYFTFEVLRRKQTGFMMDGQIQAIRMDLFEMPYRVHREVSLSEEQKNAVKHVKQPVVLTGPAGCGKTFILIEKLIHLIATQQTHGKVGEYLYVTFNVKLTELVADWISDRWSSTPGQKSVYEPGGNGRRLILRKDGKTHAKLTMRTYDSLVLDALQKSGDRIRDGKCLDESAIMAQVLYAYISTHLESVGKYKDILTPRILLDEWIFIIHGLSCYDLETYRQISRKGRGDVRLSLEGRECIWAVLRQFLHHLDSSNADSFSYRRYRLSRYLTQNKRWLNGKYDHVFIDEFQDFTDADHRIIFNYAGDINAVTMAGDSSQAIHLGKTSDIPMRDTSMARRSIFRFGYSYRLPLRIAEALEPLSRYLMLQYDKKEHSNQVVASRSAPPGARPIFVYGATHKEAIRHLAAAMKVYIPFYRPRHYAFLEKEPKMKQLIEVLCQITGVEISAESIYKIKGLERDCIIWNASADIQLSRKERKLEAIYTVLTRTSSLLFIMVTDDMDITSRLVITQLPEKRLIFWDEQALQKYEELKNMLPVNFVGSQTPTDLSENDF